jgi:uncharacterized protein (TIGR03083 family)
MHDWVALLRQGTDRFAAVVADSDPDAPVRHCPGWTLRDLADHLGGVHQWAAHAVVACSPDLTPEPAGPRDAAALADWYRGHAAHLVDVLASRPADAPAWAMVESNRTAGFWRRRQVHETTLHLWDAEDAVGDPSPLDPTLAWDGIVEVVEVVYPRQVRLGRISPLPGRLELVASDGPWRCSLGTGEPHELHASAEVLLRLLWHRADPEAEGVDPGTALLLAGALTP